jgi:hypothetical protein
MGKPAITQQDRAGIFFPPSRIKAKLQKKKTWKQISKESPVFLAAAVEHIATTILRKAASNIVQQKQSEKKGSSKPEDNKPATARIDMADIVKAVREDVDYARLFSGFAFSSAHNVPKAGKLVSAPKKDRGAVVAKA